MVWNPKKVLYSVLVYFPRFSISNFIVLKWKTEHVLYYIFVMPLDLCDKLRHYVRRFIEFVNSGIEPFTELFWDVSDIARMAFADLVWSGNARPDDILYIWFVYNILL